jgi:hypothetical protein
MSCFSVNISNFLESQKELKTDFEIVFYFFIFPVPPQLERRAIALLAHALTLVLGRRRVQEVPRARRQKGI